MSIDKTNFFSYIYSSWITKSLWKAYRSGISLLNIPAISPLDSCSCNIRKFENLWNEELRQRGPTSASLVLAAWKFVRIRIVVSCIFNACSQILRFVLYTLLLQKLLEYSEHSEKHILSGIQWTIYVVGFDLLQTILCTWSDIMNQRTALRLKAACLSLLLKKIIHSNVAYKNMNELMNILLNDGRKIYDAVNFGTSIVNGPVVTLCAAIYISICLNPLALIGLIIFLLLYLIQNPFTYIENYCTEIANDFTKSRMLKTIETINSIKLVKINGWEDHFIENITNIRNRESKWLFKATYLNSLTASMNYIIPFIAIIATFFIHFLMSQHLTTSEAFPICIVFIVQMNDSFISTRKSLYHIKQAVLTLNRIKTGLLLEDTSNHILKPFESSQAVMIINGSFAYDIYKKENYQAAMVVETKYESKLVSSEEKQHLTSSIFASKRVEVLFNITFKARKGQLIGVYGPPKCGKSSLLLAALGQMRMTSGQLMRQGSCAYVGQRPWLTHATLGDNILFGEAYDAKRYYEAQIVCKLRQDVKELVGGDKYKISDSDNKISEILKQKIALARAFYADRDIYFLDDPLHCMEDTVAEEIFENLIIRALAEKTIIFVTCELKYINRCDYMYIMRDGKIAEHGSHKELMRLGREYASLVKSAIIDAEGDYSDESCKFQKNNSSNVKKDKELSIADSWKIELESEDESYYAINENELGEKKIMTMTYYNYIKSFGGLFMLILLILTYIAFTTIGLITLLRLIWYIETIKSENILVQGVKKNNFESSKSWCGSCFFFIILGCLLKAFIMQYVGNKIADKFHTALLNKLINAPINIFDVTTLKKIKKVFLVDLKNVSLLIPPKLDITLSYIVIVIFNFFILISTIPWFTNYIVFTSAFIFFIGKIFSIAEINIKRLEKTQQLPYYKFLRNSLQGLTTIRTFKKENDVLSKFQDFIDRNNACRFFKNISAKWFSIRLQVLTTACLFVAANCIVVLKDNVSPGIAGLTFIYVIQIPSIIQISMKYIFKAKRYFASVQNIYDYLHTLSFENSNRIQAIIPDYKWPTTGLIQFDKVQLTYKDKTDLIFDNISFTINNSEKIGILSKTDICKTSLIDIMYRLCELNDGKIYVDSIDISQIDIKHLRNQLFTVPQNPIFFGTIRFFLDPKTRYTDAAIWSALEKVHLKDKVSLIASQLHYLIVGKTFSICEKQLFFLAKALLHHKKIVLLEENTTSEPKAMGLIHQILDKEFSSITVLIVAHYLSTVLPCNRILVMDNGRVLEFDNPSTLMNNQASNLRKMWRDGETVEGT